ncbi:hypothetical protein ACWGM8_31575, partial [Streptomyces albidoflavus]
VWISPFAASAAMPLIDDSVSRGIEIAQSLAQQRFEPQKQHLQIVVSEGPYGIAPCHSRSNRIDANV